MKRIRTPSKMTGPMNRKLTETYLLKSARLLTLLLCLFFVACGPRSKLHIDDQEAAVQAKGSLEGRAKRIENDPIPRPTEVAVNTPSNPTPSDSSSNMIQIADDVTNPEIKVDFIDYDNMQIKADFDSKTIQVNFDLVYAFLPEKPRQAVVMQGTIQDKGYNRGFADLKVTSSSRLSLATASAISTPQSSAQIAPPVIGKARCTDACNSVVVDIITNDASGKPQSTQFEMTQGKRTENGAVISIGEDPQETASESKQVNTKTPTQSAVEVTNANIQIDDAGSDATPGNYASAVVERVDVEALPPLQSYILEQVPKSQVEATQKTIEQLKIHPAPTSEVVVYDKETDEQSLFPLDLGENFKGKALKFYYSYCEIQKGTGKNSYMKLVPGRLDIPNLCKANKKSVVSGAIADATELVESALGIVSMYRDNKRYYGSGYLVKYLMEAGKLFEAIYPKQSLKIGQMSQNNGGPIWSTLHKGLAHASHQNGLEADIYLFESRKTGRMDPKRNWDMVKILFDLGGLNIGYTDSTNIDAFCKIAKETKNAQGVSDYETYAEALKRLQHWDGHKGHLHFRAQCTAHNPSCRKDLWTPPAKPPC